MLERTARKQTVTHQTECKREEFNNAWPYALMFPELRFLLQESLDDPGFPVLDKVTKAPEWD